MMYSRTRPCTPAAIRAKQERLAELNADSSFERHIEKRQQMRERVRLELLALETTQNYCKSSARTAKRIIRSQAPGLHTEAASVRKCCTQQLTELESAAGFGGLMYSPDKPAQMMNVKCNFFTTGDSNLVPARESPKAAKKPAIDEARHH
eukprot:5532562-Pleurochrysis_carterae.AAC.1